VNRGQFKYHYHQEMAVAVRVHWVFQGKVAGQSNNVVGLFREHVEKSCFLISFYSLTSPPFVLGQ
jgi:hypothetical protein